VKLNTSNITNLREKFQTVSKLQKQSCKDVKLLESVLKPNMLVVPTVPNVQPVLNVSPKTHVVQQVPACRPDPVLNDSPKIHVAQQFSACEPDLVAAQPDPVGAAPVIVTLSGYNKAVIQGKQCAENGLLDNPDVRSKVKQDRKYVKTDPTCEHVSHASHTNVSVPLSTNMPGVSLQNVAMDQLTVPNQFMFAEPTNKIINQSDTDVKNVNFSGRQMGDSEGETFIPVINTNRFRTQKKSALISRNTTVLEAHHDDGQVASFYMGNLKETVNKAVIGEYLMKKGIILKAIQIIPSKTTAGNGAKIVIDIIDKEKLMGTELPRGVYVRQWYDRKQERKVHDSRTYYGSRKY
jgi:hypothetical protein